MSKDQWVEACDRLQERGLRAPTEDEIRTEIAAELERLAG